MKQRVNPKRMAIAPIVTNPEPRDVRYQNRQLTLGDVGGVQQLAPELPPEVRAALHTTATADYCSVVWCDDVPTVAGRCVLHHEQIAAELHSALTRIRRTPTKSRKVRR